MAAVLFLCAATVLPYGADTRFGLIENGRLMPADFPPGLGNWNTSRSGVYLRHGGILELEADPHDAVTFARRPIPDFGRFSFLFVEAEVRALDLEAEPQTTGRARLAVESFDSRGRPLIYRLKELATLPAGTPWQRVQAFVTVGPETAFMRLDARMMPGTGTFQMRNLTIRGAEETSLFITLWAALIVLWAALGLWLALPLACRAMRGDKAVALLLLTAGGIYLGALIPKQDLLMIVEGVMDPLAGIVTIELPPEAQPMDASPLPEPEPTAEAETAMVILPEWFGVEKLGHIILFAALAFSAATAFPERHWTAAAGGPALVAITSEVLQ